MCAPSQGPQPSQGQHHADKKEGSRGSALGKGCTGKVWAAEAGSRPLPHICLLLATLWGKDWRGPASWRTSTFLTL